MQLFYSFMTLAFFVLPAFSAPIEKSRLYGNYSVESSEGDFQAEVNENGITLKWAPGQVIKKNIFDRVYGYGINGDFLETKVFGPIIDIKSFIEYTIFLDKLSIEDLENGKPSSVSATFRGLSEKTVEFTVRKLVGTAPSAIVPSYTSWLESQY